VSSFAEARERVRKEEGAMKSEIRMYTGKHPSDLENQVAKPTNEQVDDVDDDSYELPERSKTAVNVLILFLAFWVGFGAGDFRTGLFMVALAAVLIKYWEYFRR
jgi:hypothetical protein